PTAPPRDPTCGLAAASLRPRPHRPAHVAPPATRARHPAPRTGAAGRAAPSPPPARFRRASSAARREESARARARTRSRATVSPGTPSAPATIARGCPARCESGSLLGRVPAISHAVDRCDAIEPGVELGELAADTLD